MNIGEIVHGKYLSATNVPTRRVLTIRAVVQELVGPKKELKAVVYFNEEPKGFILNNINCKTIAAAGGDETDLWIGLKIVLYATETDMQGKMVPCLRVRIPVAKPTPPKSQPPPVEAEDAGWPDEDDDPNAADDDRE